VKRVKVPTMASQHGPPMNQPSVVISDALAKFIGTEEAVPQDEALKYLWDYIKANQLEVWTDGSAFLFSD
jgi:upstream activation factor subunit UAF30